MDSVSKRSLKKKKTLLLNDEHRSLLIELFEFEEFIFFYGFALRKKCVNGNFVGKTNSNDTRESIDTFVLTLAQFINKRNV